MQFCSVLLVSLVLLGGCQQDRGTATTTMAADAALTQGDNMSLQQTDTKVGTGAPMKKGQTAVVHYTGWLFSAGASDNKGTKFDSSVDRGQPFSFPLGAGNVIKGWDEGVLGMQVGGKRTLIIPPEMGYGARGAGGVIPGGATLVFEVELLGIE